MVHLTCNVIDGQDAYKSLSGVVGALFERPDDSSSTLRSRPRVLYEAYFEHQMDFGQPSGYEGVHITDGPGTSALYTDAIEQARRIFNEMFPGEDFLPSAPNPEVRCSFVFGSMMPCTRAHSLICLCIVVCL